MNTINLNSTGMSTLAFCSNGSHIAPAKIHPTTATQKKLLETAQALESTFAKNLLSAMGDKLPGSPSSVGGNIFADMFKDAIAGELSKSEALGLSRQIYNETVKMAEKQEISVANQKAIAMKSF